MTIRRLGMYLNGSNAIVSGNTVYNNSRMGIDARARGPPISGNTRSSNGSSYQGTGIKVCDLPVEPAGRPDRGRRQPGATTTCPYSGIGIFADFDVLVTGNTVYGQSTGLSLSMPRPRRTWSTATRWDRRVQQHGQQQPGL